MLLRAPASPLSMHILHAVLACVLARQDAKHADDATMRLSVCLATAHRLTRASAWPPRTDSHVCRHACMLPAFSHGNLQRSRPDPAAARQTPARVRSGQADASTSLTPCLPTMRMTRAGVYAAARCEAAGHVPTTTHSFACHAAAGRMHGRHEPDGQDSCGGRVVVRNGRVCW